MQAVPLSRLPPWWGPLYPTVVVGMIGVPHSLQLGMNAWFPLGVTVKGLGCVAFLEGVCPCGQVLRPCVLSYLS